MPGTKIFSYLGVFCLSTLLSANALAAERIVNLEVGYKSVNFAGKTVKAIAVNNQIPGPTLHFKQGDHVTINVYNQLDKGTAIHWHGLLVPWQMDGVEHVSQAPIPPKGVFHYQFTLKQSGTYWYHAHSGLQEQQGLYGAIIIDPLQPPHYSYNKDYTVVLSDWTNTDPDQVLASLKKEGDYYATQLPLQPSLVHFIKDYQRANTATDRQNLLDNYKMMQHMRMSIYDLSDVAYNIFLLNGHSPSQPWQAPVKVGDVVRLRFINAGASTFFQVKIPGTLMQIVQVQGNDVKPYSVASLAIAPAETYDVLVKISKASPYIIYAESADTSGAALGALTSNPAQTVNYQQVTPFPTPGPMVMGHNRMTMNGSMSMQHTSMAMDHSQMASDGPNADGTKYQNLTALSKTNDPNKPVHIIKMVLSGYMDRYMWFINGLPEYKAKPILIEPGQRYRLIFINDSMMHHPMHIHGHWFILRNGHGAYDPLLHTIDVPPGATLTADFDADASGQWFFHCHNLYHMMAGMSRLFRYTTFTQDNIPATAADHTAEPSYEDLMTTNQTEKMLTQQSLVVHQPGLYFANHLDVGASPFASTQQLSFNTLMGGDYNKLELSSEDAELNKGIVENANVDIFYWHLLSEFWAIKGGANYVYRPAQTPYWQPGVGIEGLMPYFIDTDAKAYYHAGSTQFNIALSRDTQITNKFFIRTSIDSMLATKTVTADEIGSGLNQMNYIVRPYYQLTPALAVFTEFEHQQDYGVLKTIRRQNDESVREDTITIGISLLF